VAVNDPALVSESALSALGLRAFARPAPDTLHLVVGPTAAATTEALRALPA